MTYKSENERWIEAGEEQKVRKKCYQVGARPKEERKAETSYLRGHEDGKKSLGEKNRDVSHKTAFSENDDRLRLPVSYVKPLN